MTIPHHGRIIPWEPSALGEGGSTESQVSVLLETEFRMGEVQDGAPEQFGCRLSPKGLRLCAKRPEDRG